ncbi:MAG: GNAT family N-acetyltransferase [Candidatus Hydrogenedentota bacterium]
MNGREDNIKIGQASLADIENIIDLWLEFVKHHSRIDAKLELDENACSYYRNYLNTLLHKDTTGAFVAKDKEKCIGYILGGLKQCPQPLKQYNYGLIAELYVDDNYRKLKIGKELLERIEEWFKLKNVKYIEVDVFSENEEGVAFWKNSRYKTKRYIMRKEITALQFLEKEFINYEEERDFHNF